MQWISGRAGELSERLLDVVDLPGPQLRAVATTLLIKAVDLPEEEAGLLEAMVTSDDAAAMIDPAAAAAAALRLRSRLESRLQELSAGRREAPVVRALRDYLVVQVRRWGTRAVDDADNRRRAERFLAWAERPEQLEAAQRRGLFAGMDADELRRMAERRVATPVTPETAVDVWRQVEDWVALVDDRLGDQVVDAWLAGGGGD